MMHPELEKLIRLQRAETDLRRAESDLAQVPQRRAELSAALLAERRRLDDIRAALDECQKARRRHEGELQELEARRSKYKGQLMDVKTNKEYTAMLHEIEGVEREIRGREDLVLAEMEKAEGLTADLKREEALFREADERHRVEQRRLEAEAARLGEESGRLRVERDGVAASLAPDSLELFQRVARLRGVAMAEARDGMCQVCHLKLRLQMYADLKRNEDIVQCPACNRILYFLPPPGAASPEP